MPSLRLHPLLIAGAACLTLAACGSDDDPPASQAKAPATTESAATTQTTPAADAPDDTGRDEPPQASGGEKNGTGSPSSTSGGKPASASVAAAVRSTVVDLQEAFAAKDGKKACSLMIGIPEKDDPANPGLSCESLSRGTKKKLSEENRKIAASAKVLVNGNEAIAELRPGVPLRLLNVDGRWRVDYSQMGRPGGGSR